MSSEPIRDPAKDYLLTPQNAALIIIDYQPTQVNSIKSMDHQTLVDHIVTVARTGVAYGLPIILSTVNVATGKNKPTVQPLLDVLPLQLLAHRIARIRGLDPDRPRNLAKTVTVE